MCICTVHNVITYNNTKPDRRIDRKQMRMNNIDVINKGKRKQATLLTAPLLKNLPRTCHFYEGIIQELIKMKVGYPPNGGKKELQSTADNSRPENAS